MSLVSKIASDAMGCIVQDPGMLGDPARFEALLDRLFKQYAGEIVAEYGEAIVEKGVSCCLSAIKAKRARASKKKETALATKPKPIALPPTPTTAAKAVIV